MDTTLMNSRTSKTSDPHKILFNISDNIDLKRSDQYVALSYLSIYYPQKDIKKLCKKYQLQHGIINLADCILYQINSEFSKIEIQFADQNSKLLEIEDKTKITLVIN